MAITLHGDIAVARDEGSTAVLLTLPQRPDSDGAVFLSTAQARTLADAVLAALPQPRATAPALAVCLEREAAVAAAHDEVQLYLSALLDPDNAPSAVFPLAIESMVTLWRARLETDAARGD